ncbi:transglutaminase-like domain-containing protein [Actinacidiphila rubida]|uniref:Transglutaminase-like superfamily protein n=1 Tax=Actinacidiphila rubida TaxID=310780 RepID=A0A1H8TWJ8_9ACTN|nr:transglutaminase-like domain-containing protein [Actinacidiphila rubida]SEO95267.1 Transglutaminase-like superfamily protein [Actinacidiphila rubida]
MELIAAAADPAAYLADDDAVDHRHPLVRTIAARLRALAPDAYDYAKTAYGFVRDTVPHSADAGDPRVTWRASDVLGRRTGICHAKSHALAALLRAEGIPAGFCYQRLTEDDGSEPVLHGLNAVLLPGRTHWSRIDARGNIPGVVDAAFSLDEERLAWPVRPELGEAESPVVHAAPPPHLLAALQAAPDRARLVLPADLPS